MTLTKDEREAAIEAMARAMCRSQGMEPDADIDESAAYGKPARYQACWTAWDGEARAALDAVLPLIERAVLLAAAHVAYSVPDYTVGDLDARTKDGLLVPGSPYDRGRYDARRGIIALADEVRT